MLPTLKKFTRDFRRNESGQFAVLTALIGLPLIMIAGFSVDWNRAVANRAEISAAIDNAALAAVIPANLSIEERKAFAKTMFKSNYFGDLDVKLNVDATRGRVAIQAESQSPTLFGGIIGADNFDLKKQTEAILTEGDVVCVLALDPESEKAIEFRDFAQYSSPTCSVQTNSTHTRALYSTLSKSPMAKSFCSAGNSYGEFEGTLKHACSPIPDPYADYEVPRAQLGGDDDDDDSSGGGSIFASMFSRSSDSSGSSGGLCSDDEVDGDNSESVDMSRFASDGENALVYDATLTPGVYCTGLKITGANVTFEPGIYHLWGDLHFTSYAGAYGKDVTFIIKGRDKTLTIDNGAQVSLKAPAEGPTAGLVFWQVYTDFFSYLFRRELDAPDEATGTSSIASGGGLKLVGTAYFPTQELVITSNSPTASESPATSIIAYRVVFGGRANMQVNVDHEAGGIPPILPRSDEGARLVQ